MPRCPLITGGVIICYQASHSQVTKYFIIPPSRERARGHMVSAAWGISSLPACGPAGPPKPGDRGGRRQRGAEPPRVPSGISTGTVGRCFQEPHPRPWHPWGGLTSAIVVTSSRQTPMRVVSLPASFLGLGQEPARKLGREVAGAHWCRGESGGLCRPGRPRPGFLQARVARPPGGQVKPQTRGDWTRTQSTAPPQPGPARTACGLRARGAVVLRAQPAAREHGGGGPRSRCCGPCCADRQGTGGDGQPRPGVRPVFSSSLFHGSGGVFVVGLAQPCSRADPGQAVSAWAALVSPTVTKVVCGLWLAHQI